MTSTLAQKLKTLPPKPGVYLFKNSRDEVLYVGQAKNLKKRVKSYFLKHGQNSPRLEIMIRQIADLDYILVSSETESLILENNLIKEHRPRFNVRLRDDKNYQFIKLDYQTEIPQIYAVRKIDPASRLPRRQAGKLQTNSYFGPYTSAGSVKHTLNLLRRIFHLCANKKVTAKPCFYYHLGRCLGVCFRKISLGAYRKTLNQVQNFLNHRQAVVLKILTSEMQEAAAKKQFEQAAWSRDKIRSLQKIWEKQKIVFIKKVSEDCLSIFTSGNIAVVNIFLVREGRLIQKEIFEIKEIPGDKPALILPAFLKQYYAEAQNLPKTVIIGQEIPNKAALQKWLKLKIATAKRGKKKQLLSLGEENAKDYYEKNFSQPEQILADLQKLFGLPRLPRRIEGYDISNLQGANPVGSMVVFEQGLPKKSDYRKFKIRFGSKPDDYAMMREMLTRRLARHAILGNNPWPLPDLIIIDGGRGQLNAALHALQATSYQLIPILGLAKRLEEIYLPDKNKPIRLPADSPVLHLLQRIRDEAHRFAVSFYRKRHRQELLN